MCAARLESRSFSLPTVHFSFLSCIWTALGSLLHFFLKSFFLVPFLTKHFSICGITNESTVYRQFSWEIQLWSCIAETPLLESSSVHLETHRDIGFEAGGGVLFVCLFRPLHNYGVWVFLFEISIVKLKSLKSQLLNLPTSIFKSIGALVRSVFSLSKCHLNTPINLSVKPQAEDTGWSLVCNCSWIFIHQQWWKSNWLDFTFLPLMPRLLGGSCEVFLPSAFWFLFLPSAFPP